MTSHMLDLVRNVVWEMDIRGPVLEIGSYIEVNQEHLDLRRAFPRGTPYIGTDILEGPGVDRKISLFDIDDAWLTGCNPKMTLCLYVIEHVWEIHKAVGVLGAIWRRDPESWLWVSTHQNQPYHATGQYQDFWRITAPGMKKLFDEVGVSGVKVFVQPDSSNPTDVLAIRQPSSMPWPEATFTNILKAMSSHWEQYC